MKLIACALILFLCSCGTQTFPIPPNPILLVDTHAAEIVSGILGGAINDAPTATTSFAHRIWQELTLLPKAYGYSSTCAVGTMAPSVFSTGTINYVYSPAVCTDVFTNGTTGTASFSSTTYNYNYASNCTGTDFGLSTQPTACVVTRTTSSPVTRMITPPSGTSATVTHDTLNPSGFSTSVVTSSGGEVITCGAANVGDTTCTTRSIVVNGSHVTSTDGWDHTVSTTAPIMVVGNATTSVVNSASLTVQDNTNQYTVNFSVYTPLSYSLANCCYPTSGQLIGVFSGGPYSGKTINVSFSPNCGEVAVAVQGPSLPSQMTLTHCL